MIKELDKTTWGTEDLGRILFYSIGEIGAQGSPGGIVIVNDKNDWYHINFIEQHMMPDEIMKKCPEIDPYGFNSYGIKTGRDDGWGYAYLGCLNHLFIHPQLVDEFADEVQNQMSSSGRPTGLYTIWEQCASHVIARYRTQIDTEFAN